MNRAQVKRLVLERDVGCRGPVHGVPGACWGPLDCHEILTRARGGSTLDPDNCITLCRKHHDWVTTHPAKARELGLMRHSWE